MKKEKVIVKTRDYSKSKFTKTRYGNSGIIPYSVLLFLVIISILALKKKIYYEKENLFVTSKGVILDIPSPRDIKVEFSYLGENYIDVMSGISSTYNNHSIGDTVLIKFDPNDIEYCFLVK